MKMTSIKKDYLKNEDVLKNEDDHKNEGDLKNEDDPKMRMISQPAELELWLG